MSGKSKQIRCHVTLLDSTPFETAVEKRARGQALFQAVCRELNLEETDYFGLTFTDLKGAKNWLNLEKRICKQLGKQNYNFKLEFKFYPPEPTQLQEDITRYQLCLQIREDIIAGRLQCSAITLALLGSYTVQSELGDYDEREHGTSPAYVQNFLFSPDDSTEVLEKTAELHRQHKGQTPAETEFRFLEIAKKLPMYGVHLHEAMDSESVSLQIGISADGIHVYRDTLRINRFVWPKVLHVSYKKKLFYIKIRPAKFEQYQSTIGFKLASSARAKRLWKEAVDHHTFFRRREIPEEKGFVATLTRLGSKYRYSGRTQHQSRQKASTIERPQPIFERTASRLSARNRKLKDQHIPIAEGPINDSMEVRAMHDDREPSYTIHRNTSDRRTPEPMERAPEPPMDDLDGLQPQVGTYDDRVYDRPPAVDEREQPAYDHPPVEDDMQDLRLPSVPTHDPVVAERGRTAVSVDI